MKRNYDPYLHYSSARYGYVPQPPRGYDEMWEFGPEYEKQMNWVNIGAAAIGGVGLTLFALQLYAWANKVPFLAHAVMDTDSIPTAMGASVDKVASSEEEAVAAVGDCERILRLLIALIKSKAPRVWVEEQLASGAMARGMGVGKMPLHYASASTLFFGLSVATTYDHDVVARIKEWSKEGFEVSWQPRWDD